MKATCATQCLLCGRTREATAGYLDGGKRSAWRLPALCPACALALAWGIPVDRTRESLSRPSRLHPDPQA